MRGSVGVAVWGLVGAALLGPEAQAASTQQIASAIDTFNGHAKYPLPPLEASQLDRLSSGKMVKIRQDMGNGPTRVLGMAVVDDTKSRLFLAASDPHNSVVDELREAMLSPAAASPRTWYQYLDLPRPFADRHWVVDVANNWALAQQTGHWEHWWTLNPNGPAVATKAVADGRVAGLTEWSTRNAVYVDTNTGAYFYITLPDGQTLFGFHAQSVVGGNIPDRLVSEYAYSTLSKVILGTASRTDAAAAHYDVAHAEHHPVRGGDGEPIEAHGAEEAAVAEE